MKNIHKISAAIAKAINEGLEALGKMESNYFSVSSKTTELRNACENLLKQQV
jgi:hypothetical protein